MALDLPPLRQVALGPGAGAAQGLRIACREAGDPAHPALLCMHGIGSNSSGYRHTLAALRDAYRVIAWDAPGYGDSEGFEAESPSVSEYADAANGLLEALGVARAHVMGSSLGALFAARLARRHPARVASLVLCAPATGFACRAPGEAEAHAAQRIADVKRLGPEGLARERAARLVAPGSSEAIVGAARELVASIRPDGYIRTARVLGFSNIFEDCPAIRVPTLIVVGSLDEVTPVAQCAGPIHQAIAGSRMEVMEGIGHLLKLEAPERLNRLVREFLSGRA